MNSCESILKTSIIFVSKQLENHMMNQHSLRKKVAKGRKSYCKHVNHGSFSLDATLQFYQNWTTYTD